MTYLDTNALLALYRDDSSLQTRRVTEALREAEIRGDECLISESVFAELVWVLETNYGMPRQMTVELLGVTLMAAGISAWDVALAERAVAVLAQDPALDPVDAILAARALMGEGVLTFDTGLRRAIEKETDS